MSNEMSHFDDLVQRAAAADDNLHAHVEPSFAAVLDFLIEHPELRPAIAERFINGLLTDPMVPEALLEYCMFELRWPEVRQRADELYKSSGLREHAVLKDILSAFSDNWNNKCLYDRWK
jgi:hypothetical protein